jgi:imidazole glycerol phosphate synthase glutamine amidotransferase subunit
VNVALIDYGAGNLRSVANALEAISITPSIARKPDDLKNATHIVLPGVGSFGDCMTQLRKLELIDPLRQWIAEGKPYLGICLGYQILFESSAESPETRGLAAFPGHVRRFDPAKGLKIPHMGWNSARPRVPESLRWKGLGVDPYFYFVHSYFPQPIDPSIVAAETDYGGISFASAIETPSLLACQFHPEKSQTAGLRLLANFFQKKELAIPATIS